MQQFLCRHESGLDVGSNKMQNRVISILFQRTMCCLEFFLSGFIVFKMKSHQQNSNLKKTKQNYQHFGVRIVFLRCVLEEIHILRIVFDSTNET